LRSYLDGPIIRMKEDAMDAKEAIGKMEVLNQEAKNQMFEKGVDSIFEVCGQELDTPDKLEAILKGAMLVVMASLNRYGDENISNLFHFVMVEMMKRSVQNGQVHDCSACDKTEHCPLPPAQQYRNQPKPDPKNLN